MNDRMAEQPNNRTTEQQNNRMMKGLTKTLSRMSAEGNLQLFKTNYNSNQVINKRNHRKAQSL